MNGWITWGVWQEIGLASWLDEQDSTNRQQVSVGTATTAMILNGLGFSNRQLYLVSQYFANKPVEHLLGQGITAEMLNDDCLGRTLDWLYAHDPTKLFAGIARRARQVFSVSTSQVHGDTTSFSVSGEYAAKKAPSREREGTTTEAEADPALITITYGYSRDHREDLKQWMLALATTHDGDIPLFLQPLDGNESDKASLLAAVQPIQEQLRVTDETPNGYVADNGIYSEANMRWLNQIQLKWISRVSETSTQAKGKQRDVADHRRREHALRQPDHEPAARARTLGDRAHTSVGAARASEPATPGQACASGVGEEMLASGQLSVCL